MCKLMYREADDPFVKVVACESFIKRSTNIVLRRDSTLPTIAGKPCEGFFFYISGSPPAQHFANLFTYTSRLARCSALIDFDQSRNWKAAGARVNPVQACIVP